MDTTTVAALSSTIGVILGAVCGAITTMITTRQTIRQRQREHLVERAYDAARAEHLAHVEIAKIEGERGTSRPVAAFSRYLVYHLVLLDRLVDLKKVNELDASAISSALDDAARLSRTDRKGNIQPGAKGGT
ncbi:hypothetical protein WJ86_14455 [Burkholderia multivorans]|nr:hypothetical protein WJ86_14455 [Burkholderia multivorans]PRF93234.1 hypothetical protein C6Q23_05880 [Burkholderia multivorans]